MAKAGQDVVYPKAQGIHTLVLCEGVHCVYVYHCACFILPCSYDSYLVGIIMMMCLFAIVSIVLGLSCHRCATWRDDDNIVFMLLWLHTLLNCNLDCNL